MFFFFVNKSRNHSHISESGYLLIRTVAIENRRIIGTQSNIWNSVAYKYRNKTNVCITIVFH